MTDPDSHDARHRLLADTLQGEWTDGPAAAMARQAAAHARRRRKRRHAVAGGSLLAAAFALVWALRHSPPIPPQASAPAIAHAPSYEIISDEEMQALLADRPVLVLPQENHAPQIVLLAR